jgi:hypothetical protein
MLWTPGRQGALEGWALAVRHEHGLTLTSALEFGPCDAKGVLGENDSYQGHNNQWAVHGHSPELSLTRPSGSML